jgi:hypothetical protein
VAFSRVAFSLGSVAVGIVLAATLAGCATGNEQPLSSPSLSATGSYSGPWASQMQYMTDNFPSDLAAQVFSDGVISEQEFGEAKHVVEECFSASGLTVAWDAYGHEAVSGADSSSNEPPPAMADCTFSDGGVMVLYYEMLMNPQNEDPMELRAACLVQAGVVERGFTGSDLQESYDTSSFPFALDDVKAKACMVDPLGRVDPVASK